MEILIWLGIFIVFVAVGYVVWSLPFSNVKKNKK